MTGLLDVLRTRFLHPLQEFIHDSRAIGSTLLACTFISLISTNLVFGKGYIDFWNLELPLPHALHLPHTLLHFINDGLMAVFFFLAGLEIKRELLQGELSSFKKSLLPIAAAVGGMGVPALIYAALNRGTPYMEGWAIPTATDIAFSIGVASLLGSRVPVSLKVFLTALAIIDDLGAILVIAAFYGGAIQWYYLLGALAAAVLAFFINRKRRKISGWFIVLGLVLWYCFFNSGIHATIAGVVLAFLVPVQQLSRLEIKLHHPVYFFIMPVFALANTAIMLPPDIGAALTTRLSWGIMAGLFLGKPLGIVLMSWLLVKLRLAHKPSGSSWMQLAGVGILAGIGFTMSIFIATLAFAADLQDVSKISVLLASFASMICGYFWLVAASRKADTTTQNNDRYA